jgi:hypothetical protein
MKLEKNGIYVKRRNDNGTTDNFFVSFSLLDFPLWDKVWKQNVTIDDVAVTKRFFGHDENGFELWSDPVDYLFQESRNRVMGVYLCV